MRPTELLSPTRKIIKEVGHFIQQESLSFNKEDIELKGKNDLVSYVDKTAEKKLVEGLSTLLPESGFIAEEGTRSVQNERFNWIIDPLDGTTNFSHGLPVYAISVALMEYDEIVLGVVHELNKDECFYSAKGEKAFLNDTEIQVSPTSSLDQSLLATGFPYYNFREMEIYLAILNDFMQQTHGLRRMGSAAVDLAYVACGRFEGFFEYNLNAWDVAAGAFIVQQAGGQVMDFKGGGDFLFGREIIAGGYVCKQMKDVISKRWKGAN